MALNAHGAYHPTTKRTRPLIAPVGCYFSNAAWRSASKRRSAKSGTRTLARAARAVGCPSTKLVRCSPIKTHSMQP